MKAIPFLSIIVPVYNGEHYIDKAVQNVINQTFSDWELILVNDCSTDGSAEKCLFWSGKDSRVKYISLTENCGAGNARNMGIDMSKGRYITFLDVDDDIEPELYKTVTDCITEDETDMVVWGVTEEYVGDNGEVTDTNVIFLKDKKCCNTEMVRKSVIFLEEKTLFGYPWNHIYRGEIIRDHNIRFEDAVLYEDYFFNLEVIKYVSNMVISSCVGYHYIKGHGGNVTSRFVPEYFPLSRRRIKTMVDAYREWELYSPTVKKISGERYLRYILAALMKNNMPEGDMNHTDRTNFVRVLYRDELYKEVVRTTRIDSRILRLLQTFINRRCTFMVLTIGRVAYITKLKLPGVFSKRTMMK